MLDQWQQPNISSVIVMIKRITLTVTVNFEKYRKDSYFTFICKNAY